MVTYTAQAGEPPGPMEGSWSLTLTSAGSDPHGTLEADLVGSAVTNTGDAGPNPGHARLAVSF